MGFPLREMAVSRTGPAALEVIVTQVFVCKKNSVPARAFYFLRHGETAYNQEGRFQGRIDVPLNERGLAQANGARAALANAGISRVVSSPALRVRQTVGQLPFAGQLDVHIDNDLMEFYVGSFEGRSYAEIRQELSLADDASLYSVLPSNADTWDDFVLRVVKSVARWLRQYPDDTLLFASHGLVFRALSLSLTGEEMISGNAQVHRFQPVDDSWEVAIAQPIAAISR
jgi:broad specificity phosphatase PhoE